MRRDADAGAAGAQRLELLEIVGDRLLAEALDAAACVRDIEKDDLDAGLRRRLDGGARLVDPEIVELADRRVARVAELRVDLDVLAADV
jgi:hypothetical protein